MGPLSQFRQGQIFAQDYSIVRLIAEGGMGAVYEARQIATDKPRALKLMKPELVSDQGLRRRFASEARIGARIRSRHVVEVIGAGIDEPTGLPWLAMEYLEGEDLAAALRRSGALPLSEVRDILSQLGHAMAAAHEVGIVHRDLKPANIYLARAEQIGAPFVVKVLDFGIAKLTAGLLTRESTTQVVGTPGYMAPEQAEPGQAVTPAADVWAMGLIAFQLLTGRQYWRTANQRPISAMGLLVEMSTEPLVPASTRAQEYGCGELLPRGFDAWFARAVVREPEARFAHAGDAMAALLPVLGVAPSSRPSPLRAWPRRVAALALVAGVALGGAAWWRHRPRPVVPPVGPVVLPGPVRGKNVIVGPTPPPVPAPEKKAGTGTAEMAGAPQRPRDASSSGGGAARPRVVRSPKNSVCQRIHPGALLQACQAGGDARSCFQAGELYLRGRCVPKKEMAGAMLIERACRLGDEEACQRLKGSAASPEA